MEEVPDPTDDLVVSKVPGKRSEAWMAVLSTAALLLGAVLAVTAMAMKGLAHGTIVLTPDKALRIIFVTVVTTGLTFVIHEGLHGAGSIATGHPYLFTTSDQHRFTRPQYIVIAALPNVLINGVLIALILLGPHSAWWVVPFAIHLSGGVGDAWLCWAALTEPSGTLVEDQRGGVRVYRSRPKGR